MALSWNEIRQRATNFISEWESTAPKAREEADAHDFQTDFLKIFGVTRRVVSTFERKVKIGGQLDFFGEVTGGRRGYIDCFWEGHILIEMKTPGKDKAKAYEQAMEYIQGIKAEYSSKPEELSEILPSLILICDFVSFDVYNLDKDNEFLSFELKDLAKKIDVFSKLAGYKETSFRAISPVDIKAAEHMGELYDALKENGYPEHDLEMYLVRLLFCLFADDAGIFKQPKIFYYYIENKTHEDGSDLAPHLGLIFEMLNKPEEKRQTNRDEIFQNFPYINGGLFEKTLSTAAFNSSMRRTLLKCCSLDWSEIKPEIFGAMFQSVKDKEKRRELGEHYTSETNILKIIKPLFLDSLWEEFEDILKLSFALRQDRLLKFHTKLEMLKFLDPACGCGNFLVVTYREIRLLEIEVLYEYLQGQQMTDLDLLIRVNVHQFYGIELEEFPARIAQTALYLMDHIMNMKASARFAKFFARFPITASPSINIGNALTLDWETIVPKDELTYILGNPPFLGAAIMSKTQKKETETIFGNMENYGVLDYVTCWYKKAAQYIQGTDIEVSFVSTNSICQGEQVPALWPDLINKHNVKINFAHQTFKWNNEAKGMAAVYCVIIGFSLSDRKNKILYQYANIASEPVETKASQINAYLVDAPIIFIEKRNQPICNVPNMTKGSSPTDDGNFLLTAEEKDNLISIDPTLSEVIRPFTGAKEFLHNIQRYCIWLKDVSPAKYNKSKDIMDRLDKIKEFRLKSERTATLKYAQFPSLFVEIRQPDTDYIIIPRHSSENRQYIPIGFLDKNIIAGDATTFIPNATLYEFGVISSTMHMAWMRYVCGRIKSDYRYSNTIVYNNFPWPSPNDKQKEAIIKESEAVLTARKKYPELSLAELYDTTSMLPELVKAHQKLDIAVETAYGRKFATDSERVTYLFEQYQKLSGELFVETKKQGKGRKLKNA